MLYSSWKNKAANSAAKICKEKSNWQIPKQFPPQKYSVSYYTTFCVRIKKSTRILQILSLHIVSLFSHPVHEVMNMKRNKHSSPLSPSPKQDSRQSVNSYNTPKHMTDDLRISPEKRICPSYDYLSIASYRVASPGKMGFRVVDNCAEEHIM